jgi:hypothetical protein
MAVAFGVVVGAYLAIVLLVTAKSSPSIPTSRLVSTLDSGRDLWSASSLSMRSTMELIAGE